MDAVSTSMDSLAPLKLLGDLTAAQLWPLTNTALPSWLLLVFLPTWKRTPTLVLLSPLLHAVLYAGTLGSVLLFRPAGAASPAVDFTTLAGVIALFDDKNAIFAGWLHYLGPFRTMALHYLLCVWWWIYVRLSACAHRERHVGWHGTARDSVGHRRMFGLYSVAGSDKEAASAALLGGNEDRFLLRCIPRTYSYEGYVRVCGQKRMYV